MDRTLFSPSMIDVFRGCPLAFSQAFKRYTESGGGGSSLSSLTKSFVKRGLAEINRSQVTTVNQVQVFVGQRWPLEKLEKQGINGDKVVRAFLFGYKTLYSYVRQPYRPTGAEVAAVSLKVRGRAATARVYLEDTFDLVLWYPVERHLEIVDFQIKVSKASPRKENCGSMVARHFLIKKLQTRWPYLSVSSTTVSLSETGKTIVRIPLNDEVLEREWQEIENDLGLMKVEREIPPHSVRDECDYCDALMTRSVQKGSMTGSLAINEDFSMSA